MSWGIVAGAAVGLVGAGLSADAAGDAADTQAASADRASARSEKQFAQLRMDLAPYRELGAGSSNLLAEYLGLPGAGMQLPDAEQYIRDSVISQWNNGYREGGNSLEQTIEGAILNYRNGHYGNKLEALTKFGYQPPAQQAQSPNAGMLLKNFTGADVANEPGYQFGLNEGQSAMTRQAAARGLLGSGKFIKDATRFATDYASTKFGEAFNRDSANKTRAYNFLSGAVSTGENAAAQTGNAGMNMAQQVGANTMGAGNALAAGQVAGANALNGAIGQGVSMYQQQNMLNRFFPQQSSGGFRYTVPTYDGAEY